MKIKNVCLIVLMSLSACATRTPDGQLTRTGAFWAGFGGGYQQAKSNNITCYKLGPNYSCR